MRFLIALRINGINMVPIWRKIGKVGYRCELVADFPDRVCVVCAPRKEKK